jgi:hypothetical protein
VSYILRQTVFRIRTWFVGLLSSYIATVVLIRRSHIVPLFFGRFNALRGLTVEIDHHGWGGEM